MINIQNAREIKNKKYHIFLCLRAKGKSKQILVVFIFAFNLLICCLHCSFQIVMKVLMTWLSINAQTALLVIEMLNVAVTWSKGTTDVFVVGAITELVRRNLDVNVSCLLYTSPSPRDRG